MANFFTLITSIKKVSNYVVFASSLDDSCTFIDKYHKGLYKEITFLLMKCISYLIIFSSSVFLVINL